MKKIVLLLLLANVAFINACATMGSNDDEISDQMLLHDRRPRDTIILDKHLETEIMSRLNEDYSDLLVQSHVNVNVYNGAVLVTGETPNEAIRDNIIAKIRVVPHVKGVHNNLAIAYPSDFDSRNNDEVMTGNIKAALAQIRTLPGFESSMVKVVIEDATVYLMGMVHRSEGDVVINVVRHQPDVKQIVTVFEYLD